MIRGSTDRYTCPKCGETVRAVKREMKVGPLAGAAILLSGAAMIVAGFLLFYEPARERSKLATVARAQTTSQQPIKPGVLPWGQAKTAVRPRPTLGPTFGDPTTIWIVKRGVFAAISEDLLDRALAIVESGDRAAMAKLMEGGGVFILKVGTRVYVTDFWLLSSKIKIRPVGEAVEFWTTDRALR